MKHDNDLSLQTERLILRSYTKDDIDLIYPIISRKEIADTTIMIPHPYPKDTLYWWIDYVQKILLKRKDMNLDYLESLTLKHMLVIWDLLVYQNSITMLN